MAEHTEKEHSVVIKNRATAQISGVAEVVAYDEQRISATGEHGAFAVYGQKLKILSFDGRSGLLSISGSIDSVAYAKRSTEKKSFFARLAQ